MDNKKTGKSQQLWRKAKKLIPGGSQLLSKRAEMFLPEQWPAYYKKAKGAEVTDLDGKKYIDMSLMGVGACVLGYADPDVDKAVKKAIDAGSMSTLNVPEEVELAELLISLHPWIEMVRYARTGGEAMAVAVRIARAYSKKSKVAFSGYHGWHDWYLSTNIGAKDNLAGIHLAGLEPSGVPKELKDTSIPFHYNDIERLRAIVKEHDIGAIVLEPMRHQEPKDGFLQEVRKIADRIGAVLVFDEISSGFRMQVGGIHAKFGVTPDIAVFGKAMSNGYPMAVITGKKRFMEAAQGTFISSTYWTEKIGPAAALATIKKMQEKDVPAHIDKIGKMIWKGWEQAAKKHGLGIVVEGPTALVNFAFKYKNVLELKTLFTQEMLRLGFLAVPIVYVSYAHTEEHVKKYLAAVDEVFGILVKAIKDGNVRGKIDGPVCHGGFERLT
ncbi:MAG: aminotransferase class III-fold pyridoxal phosphate-dependent enzyme [Minisyncoccia bacterium]